MPSWKYGTPIIRPLLDWSNGRHKDVTEEPECRTSACISSQWGLFNVRNWTVCKKLPCPHARSFRRIKEATVVLIPSAQCVRTKVPQAASKRSFRSIDHLPPRTLRWGAENSHSLQTIYPLNGSSNLPIWLDDSASGNSAFQNWFWCDTPSRDQKTNHRRIITTWDRVKRQESTHETYPIYWCLQLSILTLSTINSTTARSTNSALGEWQCQSQWSGEHFNKGDAILRRKATHMVTEEPPKQDADSSCRADILIPRPVQLLRQWQHPIMTSPITGVLQKVVPITFQVHILGLSYSPTVAGHRREGHVYDMVRKNFIAVQCHSCIQTWLWL